MFYGLGGVHLVNYCMSHTHIDEDYWCWHQLYLTNNIILNSKDNSGLFHLRSYFQVVFAHHFYQINILEVAGKREMRSPASFKLIQTYLKEKTSVNCKLWPQTIHHRTFTERLPVSALTYNTYPVVWLHWPLFFPLNKSGFDNLTKLSGCSCFLPRLTSCGCSPVPKSLVSYHHLIDMMAKTKKIRFKRD